jgi:hypothetical protein
VTAEGLQDHLMTTVWVYVDTNHEVGHPDHLKLFATQEAADEWFQANDPEGVAYGYELIGDSAPEQLGPLRPPGTADFYRVPKAEERRKILEFPRWLSRT